MAMTSTLQQVQSAQMGTPTMFVLAVINGGGSQVIIKSIQPVVKRADGSRYDACNVSQLFASPSQSSAQVGGSQFNYPVAGSATVYFSFQVSFYGPAISGGPTQPNMQFLVDAVCSYDDNTTSGCNSALLVNLNQPQFGQAPGAPPNPVPAVGQLDFQSPFQSAFTL